MIKFFRRIRKSHLMKNKTSTYLKYALGEIILVVIGILLALQINNWNENRKANEIENSILIEIVNGLQKDLIDINANIQGHINGVNACHYWNKLINDQHIEVEAIASNYSRLLRNFIALQNTSSYESLKSRGLELIASDSLRLEIISLYEEDYKGIKKIEEDYQETQYYDNYFDKINELISPNLIFDSQGELISIQVPLNFTSKTKNEMQSYLWNIKSNREFTLSIYEDVDLKIQNLIEKIKNEIAQNNMTLML